MEFGGRRELEMSLHELSIFIFEHPFVTFGCFLLALATIEAAGNVLLVVVRGRK